MTQMQSLGQSLVHLITVNKKTINSNDGPSLPSGFPRSLKNLQSKCSLQTITACRSLSTGLPDKT